MGRVIQYTVLIARGQVSTCSMSFGKLKVEENHRGGCAGIKKEEAKQSPH